MLITNENCILVTEENHAGYSCHCGDIGKFLFKYPHQFHEGKTFPKEIVVDNISMFDHEGKELLGYSVHAGFNTETDGLDQCIGFITYLHKSTTWKLMRNNKYALIWFKDLFGNPIKFRTKKELEEEGLLMAEEDETNDEKVISPRFVINGYLYF